MFKIPGHQQISGTVRHTLVNGVHNVRTQMAVSIQIAVDMQIMISAFSNNLKK